MLINKNFITLLISFLALVGSAKAEEFRYVFQHDTYIQKNDCEDVRISGAKAFQLRTIVSPKMAKKNMVIQFRELKSGFSQKAVYDTKTFFYPGVFTAQGHHEYGMPECDLKDGNCELSIFIFLSGDILKKPTWDIDVNITESNGSTEIMSGSLKDIKNQFLDSDQKFFTGLDFKTSSEILRVGYADPKKVQQLLNEGFEVKFVFSWRNTFNQVEYSEEFHTIKNDDPWLKKKSFEFAMDQKLMDPIYLSFMVLAQKQTTSFESKIVIVDKKNEFFKQCKK